MACMTCNRCGCGSNHMSCPACGCEDQHFDEDGCDCSHCAPHTAIAKKQDEYGRIEDMKLKARAADEAYMARQAARDEHGVDASDCIDNSDCCVDDY